MSGWGVRLSLLRVVCSYFQIRKIELGEGEVEFDLQGQHLVDVRQVHL